jgi:hypothetical protein
MVNEETHLAGLAMNGNDVLGVRPKVELHLLSSKVQQGERWCMVIWERIARDSRVEGCLERQGESFSVRE